MDLSAWRRKVRRWFLLYSVINLVDPFRSILQQLTRRLQNWRSVSVVYFEIRQVAGVCVEHGGGWPKPQ